MPQFLRLYSIQIRKKKASVIKHHVIDFSESLAVEKKKWIFFSAILNLFHGVKFDLN